MDNLLIQALKEFPLIQPGDNLSSIILESCKHNKFILEDDDIIVIAQKVVSKSENRYKNLLEIKPSKQATNFKQRPSFYSINIK